MLGKTVGIVVLTVGALSVGMTGAPAARYYHANSGVLAGPQALPGF